MNSSESGVRSFKIKYSERRTHDSKLLFRQGPSPFKEMERKLIDVRSKG